LVTRKKRIEIQYLITSPHREPNKKTVWHLKIDHTPTGNVLFGVVEANRTEAAERCLGFNAKQKEVGFFA